MHFFEFKVDSDARCQSLVLYTTHMNIIKSNLGELSPATRKKDRQQNSRLHSIVCNLNVHTDVMEYLDSLFLLSIYGL